jgi:hypothetical protein
MLPPGTVSPNEQASLIGFLDAGNSVYLEGTNIGEDHNGTTFWEYLGPEYLGQGELHNEVNMLYGIENEFTGYSQFEYQTFSYADIFINRFGAGSGSILFESQDDLGRIVTKDTGTYRAITSSAIFGAMINGDGINQKENLMSCYLSYLLDIPGPDIWVSHNEIDFGELSPGNPQISRLYIQNTGQDDLGIISIGIQGNGFELEPPAVFSLEFGAFVQLDVIFPADEEGTFSADLVIISDDPDQPEIVIPLYAQCYSDEVIEVDPVEIFVEMGNDQVATEYLNISNSGGAPLEFGISLVEIFNERDSGGPDEFGYYWLDSNESEGPEFEWMDISEIGTNTGLDGIDNFVLIELPFAFRFYGTEYNEIKVSTNGYLTFDDDAVDYSNDPIPFNIAPNDFIAPFWDDLKTGDGSNYIYFDEANMRLIVQYSNWEKYSGGGDLNFQVHLYETGEIFFYYLSMDANLMSATVGIENPDASDGLEIAYNQAYIEDGLAVRISSKPEWLDLDVYSGIITGGESQTIELTLDSTELEIGMYQADIRIFSSDPANPVLSVPLSLEVMNTAFGENNVPAGIKLYQNYPNPFNPATVISFSITDVIRDAELIIYNTKGQLVRKFSISVNQSSVTWDGKDLNGQPVHSGMYLYQLKTDNRSETRKMMLIK